MSSGRKLDLILAGIVRRRREERGMTQEMLAFSANLTVSTLARIERGVSNPVMDDHTRDC